MQQSHIKDIYLSEKFTLYVLSQTVLSELISLTQPPRTRLMATDPGS